MDTQVVYPDPMLADNKKTVEYLKEIAGDDEDAIAEVEEWGVKRQKRIATLRKFVAFLEKNGILEENGQRMEWIVAEFTIEQCFAIATKYGLDDMGYEFYDSRSGALTGSIPIDLQAVMSVPVNPSTDLFESPEKAAEFLDAIRGKDVFELGKMAKPIVLTRERRAHP